VLGRDLEMDNDDSASTNWNDFQVVLYPDGRVRWNTRFMNGDFPEYSLYSGIYAGADAEPFEVQAGWGRKNQHSYLHNPERARDISTIIRLNTIDGDGGGYNINLYNTRSHRVIANQTDDSLGGLSLVGTTADTEIIYNVFADTNRLWNSTSVPVTAEYNYWGLTDATAIDAVIMDDDENPAMGTVDFEPFLTEVPESPAVVDAGDDDTVLEGVLVTLHGSNTAGSLDIIEAALWEQISGTATVVLSDPTVPEPTFTAPEVDAAGDVLVFQVTATDIYGLETVDTVTVTIYDTPPAPPVAVGGDSGGSGCFIDSLICR